MAHDKEASFSCMSAMHSSTTFAACKQQAYICCAPWPCCRSLFEKDKLLFAMMLATKLKLDTGAIMPQELRFFKTGGVLPSLHSSKMMGCSECKQRLSPDLCGA
jgi:hypothetical protein